MATITLTNFLTKINNHLGDNLSSTTTAQGNAGKTTFIDSAMSKYNDDYFASGNNNQEWWVYLASQLKAIKSFTSSSGTFEVYSAFSAQVAASTAYSLHRFNRDDKIIACNQALYECYPDFYKDLEDATTLDGTGSSDNKYTVPATFTEFPDQIWSIDDDTTDIVRTQITDYQMEKINGSWYFYADITTGEDILLVGKTYLTQFTPGTDSSTTELDNSQAEVVSLLAASIFYRTLSGKVNTENSERFDALSNRYLEMYRRQAMIKAMPRMFGLKQDFAWTNE